MTSDHADTSVPPFRLGILTAPQLADLTADDRLAVPFLQAAGIAVTPVIWTEPLPAVGLDALLMRSTWAYYQQPDAFAAWLKTLATLNLPIWNPPATMLANLDKRYLLDLLARHWPVVPTYVLERPDPEAYARLRQTCGWDKLVVRPVVSASGFETHRLDPDQPLPASLLELNQALLVQPYCRAIETAGEISLVFLNGRFSHAVRKLPGLEQFLIHEDHGGSTGPVTPPPALLAMAEALVAAEASDCLYVRVDCELWQDQWCLMELELLEPALYLSHDAGAPARLANAVAGRIRDLTSRA